MKQIYFKEVGVGLTKDCQSLLMVKERRDRRSQNYFISNMIMNTKNIPE